MKKIEKIRVKQATKDSHIWCDVGGVFDASFPNSMSRRGRVLDDGWTCPTIQTSNCIYRIEKINEDKNSM